MWFMRWIIVSVLAIGLLILILQNVGNIALTGLLGFKFLGKTTPQLPVFVWMILSFCAGAFLVAVVAIVREIKLRAELYRLKKDLPEEEEPALEAEEETGEQV